MRLNDLLLSGLALVASGSLAHAQIPIAELERDTPVDFAKEIAPVFKKNCIACHNSSKAKGKLNLETPKSILKGGSEGPAVIAGKPEESFLLQVAAQQEDPVMPPEKNKSNAVPLTSEELGLLKLWIAEGAKGDSFIAPPTPTHWMLAKRQDYPVYHMALGPEDRFVAASRGQRVFLYDIRQGTSLGELVDPQLATQEVFKAQPPAHQDFVQSIAFSPDGWLATGGFRNAKLWKPDPHQSTTVQTLPEAVSALAVTVDGAWSAAGDSAGHVLAWGSETRQGPHKWHEGKVTSLAWSADGAWLATSGVDGKLHLIKAGAAEIAKTHEVGQPIHAVALLPNRVLAATESGKILQWSLEEGGEALTEIAAHEKPVMALALHPLQPNQIFSGSGDGIVKQWDLLENKVVRTFEHGTAVVDLAISPNGEQLISLATGNAKVWNTQDGAHLRDLVVNPEATLRQERLNRRQSTTQILVDNRKKKVTEQEKAWNGEVEKAKKAASDQLAAKAKRDEADLAEHKARMHRVDHQPTVDRANTEVASLKKQVEETEANAKRLGEQLAQQSEAQTAQIQALQVKLEEATAEQTEATKLLADHAAIYERLKSTKAEAQNALASLRKVSAVLDGANEANDAVLLTENLLADVQQRLSMHEADVTLARTSETALANRLQSLQSDHADATSSLKKLRADQATATKSLEDGKASLAKAEESAKQLAETHKKAEEEAKKAQEALDAASKAHVQALENEELALRLSQRASEAHTRAQTALTIAETKLKQGQEAIDADAKVEVPALTQVAYSRDGSRIALGRTKAGLLLFNAEGDQVLETLTNTSGVAIASLADGQWLTAVEKSIRAEGNASRSWSWKRTIGAIVDPKVIIDRVTAVAFSPNGTLLVTGSGSPSRSGQLKVWRVSDGSLVMEVEDAHSDTIVGLEFSPDGQYLATASTDRFAKVFRVSDGSLITAFEGHTAHVLDVSWRADGLVLATAGADNVIKLWDFEEERQIKTINGYNQEITSVAFADVAEKLVTSSGDKSVRLGGDRMDGKGFVYTSALTQDGQWVIAGSQDSVVRVWQAKDKKLVQEFAAPTQ